jgi:predicted lipoprotein with Yx(FWY)xxD motif
LNSTASGAILGARLEEMEAMTRTRLQILAAVLLVSLVLVPLTANAESTAVSSRATVKVAFNKKLKKSILVDGRGLTLYMYVPDTPRQPACYNDATYHCSKAWPPLLTTGAPRGQGIKPSLLDVVKRKGGDVQVTYNGHPLYTDAGAKAFGLVADKKPGDVNGQRFLSIWYVLSPKGTPIRAA